MYNEKGRMFLVLRFCMCAEMYKKDRIDIHQSHNHSTSSLSTFKLSRPALYMSKSPCLSKSYNLTYH